MSGHCELNFSMEFRMTYYNTYGSAMTEDESYLHM